MNQLAYLSTPYTKYPQGIHIAFRHASKLAARLIMSGVHCYSPIAYCHPLAEYGGIDPLDQEFWLHQQETMMARCDVLIVAHMEGWEVSRGIAHEIEFFLKANKPIFDLDPKTLQMARRDTAATK